MRFSDKPGLIVHVHLYLLWSVRPPDVLAEETDEQMIEFAAGGVCNCCLGKFRSL